MSLIENIGGIFIYVNDAIKLRNWYKVNLQLDYQSNEEYGVHWTEFWYYNQEQQKKIYSFFNFSNPKSTSNCEKLYH